MEKGCEIMSDLRYDRAAVGGRIREKRLALHLTQEKVAEQLDKSLRLVTELERGAVGMSIETLLRLCDVLKTTPNELLLPGVGTDEDELQWAVDALTNASARVREGAVDILRAYLRAI